MYNYDLKDMGERLKKLRKARNISVKELANSIDRLESTVYRYERGSIKPDLDSLIAICNTLNISLNDLFDTNDTFTTAISSNPFKENTMYLYYIGYQKMLIFKLEFSRKAGYEQVIFKSVDDKITYFEGVIETDDKRAYITLHNYEALNTKFEKVLLILNVTYSSDNMFVGAIMGTEDKSDMPMIKKCILMPVLVDETDEEFVESLKERLNISDIEKEKLNKEKFLTIDITNKLGYKII